MKEPIWIDKSDALAIHDELLGQHGGAQGIRDETLLESALARAQQHFAYAEKPDVIEMAAAYMSGIVRNHPFVDGNKRTGFVVGTLFLELEWVRVHGGGSGGYACGVVACGGEVIGGTVGGVAEG